MSYQAGFQSLEKEISIDGLSLKGKFPAWLEGTLFRTGPAKFDIEGKSLRHWFDGLAMLHRFSFGQGKVVYANKFLQSTAYRLAQKSRKLRVGEFATDPCRGIFGRLCHAFFPRYTDNGSVNIWKLAEHILAVTETPVPIEFDRQTLKTLGPLRFQDQVNGHFTVAHPHFDGNQGLWYSYVARFAHKSVYQIYSLHPTARSRQILCQIPVSLPSYMHSFAITQNYIVLTEIPLLVSPLEIRFSGKAFIENYHWQAHQGTRFWIVRKEDGKVITRLDTEAFFHFHHVNAFEDQGDILVDIVTYPDSAIIDQLYLDRLRSPAPSPTLGKLKRFRLSFQGKTSVEAEMLSSEYLELPRINYERSNMNPYRFLFAAGNRIPGNFFDQLVKIDLKKRTSQTWFEDDCYPGEPVFVGTPQGQNEDSGVILSVVFKAKTNTSFLLALDAESYLEKARAQIPHAIPFGFHGQYFSEGGCH